MWLVSHERCRAAPGAENVIFETLHSCPALQKAMKILN
jgi:hypothetical protein